MEATKGLFITLEGGEGSGKSTLLNQIGEHLTQKGYEVIKTREPGGSQLGETVRQWLLNQNISFKIGSQAELLLFLAARSQHIEELIKPALIAGKVVLCDRFNDSTIAYQGAARGLDMQNVQQLCQLVCGNIQPHLTLFLDVEPLKGLSRTKSLSKDQAQEGQLDRIEAETLEFHEKVRKAFLSLAQQNSERIFRIDANIPQANVLADALKILDELLIFPRQTRLQ